MAVYTAVEPAALAAFLAPYGIGEALALNGIAEGVENSNFRLTTPRGRHVLTLYERRVAAGDLPFFLGLMDHLAARGVPCPRPLRRADGGALGSLAGRPAAIVTHLDGASVRAPSPAHARAAGAALARLHRAGEGFPIRRPNALGPAGWPALANAARARADDVAPGLAALIDAELAHLADAWPAGPPSPGGLPGGVIHADLFPDNVFFAEAPGGLAGGAADASPEVSGIIDFYFAADDLLAYDLAVCLNAWGFDERQALDSARAGALLAGYAGERPLLPAEVAALPALARGAALRFLLTRLNDWLVERPGALVTPHDPLEYERRLRALRRPGALDAVLAPFGAAAAA